jgi:hypothetical protein
MNKKGNSFDEEPERVNRYIDALYAEKSTAGLEIRDDEEARLLALARTLKVAAHPEAGASDPGFADALERRLLGRYRAVYRRQDDRPWWKKMPIGSMVLRRAGLATALALSLLLLFAAGTRVRERFWPSLPPLPSLVSIARAYSSLEGSPQFPGVLGDIEFELKTPLPITPGQITVYQQSPDPVTMTEATDLAQRFGIEGDVHRVGNSLIAEDEHGRLVVFSAQKGYYQYQRSSQASSLGSSIEPSEAIRLARIYLEERNLLDFDHGPPLVTRAQNGTLLIYQILFPQMAEGLPVENAGVTVSVTEAAELREIKGRVLHLEPVGRAPVLSAEAAYDLLQNRGPAQAFLVEVNQAREGSAIQAKVRQVQGPLVRPPFHPGDHVELEGILGATIRQDASGMVSHTYASILPEGCGFASMTLMGPKVDQLAAYDRFRIRVWGQVAADKRGMPALIVEGYQRTHSQEQAVLLLGWPMVEKVQGEDRLLLHSLDGARYALSRWCQDSQSLVAEHPEWLTRKVLVSGILSGDRVADEYPVVRADQVHTGSEIDQMQSIPDGIISRPAVVHDAFAVLRDQGFIEEASLVFFAFPVPLDSPDDTAGGEPYRYLLPAYRLKGYTTEGLEFAIYVQAGRVRD